MMATKMKAGTQRMAKTMVKGYLASVAPRLTSPSMILVSMIMTHIVKMSIVSMQSESRKI